MNKIKKITGKKAIVFLLFAITCPILSCFAYSPAVQLYINGSSDSSVTVSYNSSVDLSWSSNDVDYCTASGDWSGTKSVSGLETISNITSSKTFIINCYSASGSARDEITVNVTSVSTSFQMNKLVRNVTDGTAFLDSVWADPGDNLSFQITISAGSSSLQNIIVKDTLPVKIIYLGNLRIDNVASSGNIISGFNIGNLSANQTKTITFDARIADSSQFSLGITNLINAVLVYNTLLANTDTAKVIINKTTGTGPTNVSTGITNSIFFDSFLLPLAITVLIIWLFKSHIINFEEWIDSKKKKYQSYKARKTLEKIRAKESLQKKNNIEV